RPVPSALLGEDLFRFLGLLDALVQGLLRGLLGLAQATFAPQDARQVEIGFAVRGQRGGLLVVLDRKLGLVGEVVRLPQRQVGLVVGLDDALRHAVLDDRDAFLLAPLGVEVQREQVAVVAVLGELALGAQLLEHGDGLVVLVGLHVDRGQVHLQLLVVGIAGGLLLGDLGRLGRLV